VFSSVLNGGLKELNQSRHISFGNVEAVYLDTLTETHQMWRSIEPNFKSRSAVYAFQERAGGTFSVSACDMNEAQSSLRIAAGCGQFECVIEAGPGSEHP